MRKFQTERAAKSLKAAITPMSVRGTEGSPDPTEVLSLHRLGVRGEAECLKCGGDTVPLTPKQHSLA